MSKNKTPGDICSIKFVQIAEWKISEELAPTGCFANGKQFCVDLGFIYTRMLVHTHTQKSSQENLGFH